MMQSLRNLENSARFQNMVKKHPILHGFAEPLALLEQLGIAAADLDNKDRVLGALVLLAQGRDSIGKLAHSLLFLGLWPGLDAIFGRWMRGYPGGPDELASELAASFATTIRRADLRRISRVAATLVRNTERRLQKRCERARRCVEHEQLTKDGTVPHASENDVSYGYEGLDGLARAESKHAVRDFLTNVVGSNADLLMLAIVEGVTQLEAADRLGITHAAARKRFQRAKAQVGDRMSQFRGTGRVYLLERITGRSKGAKR